MILIQNNNRYCRIDWLNQMKSWFIAKIHLFYPLTFVWPRSFKTNAQMQWAKIWIRVWQKPMRPTQSAIFIVKLTCFKKVLHLLASLYSDVPGAQYYNYEVTRKNIECGKITYLSTSTVVWNSVKTSHAARSESELLCKRGAGAGAVDSVRYCM